MNPLELFSKTEEVRLQKEIVHSMVYFMYLLSRNRLSFQGVLVEILNIKDLLHIFFF